MKTRIQLKKLLAGIALVFVLGAGNAVAGDLALQSTVAAVTNTGSNQKNFSVKVSGGSGPCIGVWITFPEVDAADLKVHQRAYAAALLAMSTGMPVRIYSYMDNGCEHASYIEVGR